MKVFTIIVTYNGVKWIDACLKSVVGQSEVIVVDNNSIDDTLNHIRVHFPNVIVLPLTKNLGFGVANNVGISYAMNKRADAVFLLNQDACAGKDCINKLVEASRLHKEFGIISPVHFNGDGSALDYSFQKLAYMSPLISDLITKRNTCEIYDFKFINAAAWFIPKDVFYKVGGFDSLFFMYGEDDNFSQRVLYHNFKIGVIPNAVIFHDSPQNNYQLGDPGSEKYYEQFLNSVFVKYANINAKNYKKLWQLKFYLLRIAFLKLLIFNKKEMMIYLEKHKRLDIKSIKNSVQRNKESTTNYLEIK